ncbi:LysR substrate-binding domain-containing protein [Labrys okinawensis]|uniref:LysR substrate-binding domain-containing protein n=1 Tax=Labrys okinawensis TaxID=346911 RepID=UPI0039BD37A7
MMEPAMPNRFPAAQQLWAFVTVTQHGNFSRAASALNLTQSAVSHQIRKLEASVGRKLLVRSAHGIALTRAGESLLNDVAEPLHALSSAVERCRAGGVSKRLCLELDSGFAAAWLAPRIGKFQRQYPDVQLEHFYSIKITLPEHVDLAIKWGNGRWAGYLSEPLMGLRYTPMCAPALLQENSQLKDLGELRRFELLHDRDRRDWADWLTIARLENFSLENGHVVNDTNVLMRMVASGEGIGLCALELAEHALASGELAAPFPDLVLTSRDAYHIVRKQKSNQNPNVEAFIAWLKSEVRAYKNESRRS